MTTVEAREQPPLVPLPHPHPLPKKSPSILPPQKLPRVETTGLYAASDSDGSELTPLPSPLEMTTDSDGKSGSGERLNPLAPSTPKRRAAPHLADPWEVETLGTYVWVLLDLRFRVLELEDVGNPEECNKEGLWWPGKVRFSLKNHTSRELNESARAIDYIQITESLSSQNSSFWDGFSHSQERRDSYPLPAQHFVVERLEPPRPFHDTDLSQLYSARA